MRLWTVHPSYLDAAGLTAAWREGLLAKAVLGRRTIGYRHHPQLERFRATKRPLAAINTYLAGLLAEAQSRGYHFDEAKVGRVTRSVRIHATVGQLAHEWVHLLAKLRRRAPARFAALRRVRRPRAHPMFVLMPGVVAIWEKSPRALLPGEGARRGA